LRTGDLRDAIEVRPIADGVSVGVHADSPMELIAAVHEFGSVNVPPRPFIGTAPYLVAEAITEKIESRVVAVINGKT
jgi:hypothetical protein